VHFIRKRTSKIFWRGKKTNWSLIVASASESVGTQVLESFLICDSMFVKQKQTFNFTRENRTNSKALNLTDQIISY